MKFEHGFFADASPDALTPGAVRDWTGDETYGSSLLPAGWRRSWQVSICERCWVERRGMVQPVRLTGASTRTPGANVCGFCGRPTWASIFVRADPLDVPYPALELVE